MEDDYDERLESQERRYDLLGIRFDWRFRKIATDVLSGAYQLELESQLDALGPTLSEDVADAAKELDHDGQVASLQDTRKQESSREAHSNIVEDLKRSNFPPTPGQALLLKSDLETRNSELLSIDHDILRLQLKINESLAAMHTLLRVRLEKQKEATYRQSWLSSARLLPADVLIRILKFAKSNLVGSRTSVLQLSHVCSSWRHAALTCRSLWNDIALNLWSPTDEQATFSSLLSFWFGRANHQSLPLSLDVLIETEIDAEVGEDFFRGVNPFVSRLGNIEITIRRSLWRNNLNTLTNLGPFLGCSGGSLSQLSHLCLIDDTDPEGEAERDLPFITVFDQSPFLHTVVLHLTPPMFRNNDHLHFPWSQLTCLTIGGHISVRGFANIFFQCRRLCTVVFYYLDLEARNDDVWMTSIPQAPVTFPDLKEFRLRLSKSSRHPLIIRDILSKIRLPMVQVITFIGGTYHFRDHADVDIPLSDILSLSLDKHLSLRRLALMNVVIDLQDLLSLLNAVPMLEDLSLCTPLSPQPLLEALTRNENLVAEHQIPSLSNLVSFLFTFHALKVHENPDVDLVANAFGSLVASWITDPTRRGSLSEASLCMGDDSRFLGRIIDPIDIQPVCDRVEELIHHQIGKDSDVRVVVRVFDQFQSFVDFVHMGDPTSVRQI
ncbi:hypothetical protein C0995_009189 [Termitomyces sp. Mi166|nr:hypothetical protein C0995_009189 [Termitomyces sp. Mi166\